MSIIDFKNKLAQTKIKQVSFFNSIKHYLKCCKVALYKVVIKSTFVSVI